MAQTCTKCSRVNPPEAAYCYFDGCVLPGHGANGAPVSAGSKPFPSPFVFPNGKACRNFDELALACQQNWSAARDLLKQGYLETFFGSLGRSDLSLAAREAGRYPDRDRGLDQLLAKLPSHVLPAPRVRVEPMEVNLGVVPLGQDRKFDLHLENQGMRLVYGSVTCDDGCDWLELGEQGGAPQKLFQFGGEQSVAVRVRGKRLRAGNKPLEGRLLVESNGGNVSVLVRAEVPVKPFPNGALAGAKSPRQVAEKAKARPKEASALFESGAVARWYKENGWSYPVQGPSASGLGAVQQFFEALGLTPPPKVEISEKAVYLQGNPGALLRHSLEVRTQERRPVYAHGVSSAPWLEVGRPRLNGRTATIPLAVPSVPAKVGQVLSAKVTVTANGNQRFVVPVTLTVGGSVVVGSPLPVAAFASEAEVEVLAPTAAFAPAPIVRSPYVQRGPNFLHALPALLLALVLFGVLASDLLTEKPPEVVEKPPDPPPVAAKDGWEFKLKDREPRLEARFGDRHRFGLTMRGVADPRYQDRDKQLTYFPDGSSNNTIVRIGGYEFYFGNDHAGTKVRPRTQIKDKRGNRRLGWITQHEFVRDKVLVTQHVEIVPGSTGFLDTCLVYYTVENQSDSAAQKVGLRVMLDTFIGANDGVPFTIPGEKGFLNTLREFDQKEVPDYVEAVENPDDPDNPGTVARLGLQNVKLPGVNLEPIERMLICRWPGNQEEKWQWEPTPMNSPADKPADSCVALYWPQREMNPRDMRRMAFTYGLGELTISGGDGQEGDVKLALSAPSSVRPNAEFVVTAYVYNAKQGQAVALKLPPGLSLVEQETPEKAVEETARRTQVFWKVKAGRADTYKLEATADKARAERAVKVNSSSIFTD